MADTASPISEVAERYASALFELALEAKMIPAVEKELTSLAQSISDSADLQRLFTSPVFSKEEQLGAVDGILKKGKASDLVGNFVRVVAANRRLFAISGMIERFNQLAAEHRGEVNASVISAAALTAAEVKELQKSLKDAVGKDVTLQQSVDPEILGGLIVKIGSRQIDTSLRSKLSSLKLTLKEVG